MDDLIKFLRNRGLAEGMLNRLIEEKVCSYRYRELIRVRTKF